MPTTSKKRIFWFEEDPDMLEDYSKTLREKYFLDIGAQWDAIRNTRQQPFDLIIVDLMIHRDSFSIGKGNEVENVGFDGVEWQKTGLEFLARLRIGEYKEYGFPADIDAIVATAVATYPAYEDAKKHGVKAFLEKPFTIEELETAIAEALNPSRS